MSNSFHMSMSNSSVSVADSLAGIPDADGDEDKPDKMELLVGDVKGKVSSDRLGFHNVPTTDHWSTDCHFGRRYDRYRSHRSPCSRGTPRSWS